MQTVLKRISGPLQREQRSAVVTVELSIVLPVLMILVIGVVETCNLFYVKQSLTIAAYEGARAAIVKGMVLSDINARSNQVLADRHIAGATVTVTPNPPSGAAYGTYITVKVQHTRIAMPESDYKPRLDDPRIGYFTHQITYMTSVDLAPYRDVIHR